MQLLVSRESRVDPEVAEEEEDMNNDSHQKIRIAFHVRDIGVVGGLEKVTLQVAGLLLDVPNKYEVFVISSSGDMKPFFNMNEQIKLRGLDDRSTGYFGLFWKMRRLLRRERIDILIGTNAGFSIFDLPACWLAGTKYIAWEHGNFFVDSGSRAVALGRRLSMKFAKAVVVLTKRDKRNFAENLRGKANLKQVYNPFFVGKSDVKHNARTKRILSVGRVDYDKGIDLLLAVAGELSEMGLEFEWNVFGEVEEKEELNSKIKEMGLSGKVVLRGRKKKIQEEYGCASLFVMTSRHEGFPLVLLEAQANLLPCVAFDIDTGPDEIIEDGVNGFLVKDFNVEEMAKKIHELMKNPGKLEELSKRSLDKAAAFAPEKILRQWEELICQVEK